MFGLDLEVALRFVEGVHFESKIKFYLGILENVEEVFGFTLQFGVQVLFLYLRLHSFPVE